MIGRSSFGCGQGAHRFALRSFRSYLVSFLFLVWTLMAAVSYETA